MLRNAQGKSFGARRNIRRISIYRSVQRFNAETHEPLLCEASKGSASRRWSRAISNGILTASLGGDCRKVGGWAILFEKT